MTLTAIAILLFSLLAAAWALRRLWRIIAIGSAYKAKVLSAIIFGSARSVDPRRVADVSADSYRLLRLLGADVDPIERSVTVSLLGLRPRKAQFRSGVQPSPARDGFSWRERNRSAALTRVVASAFSEPNPKRLRRTRALLVIQDGHIVAEQYASGFSEQTPFSGWSMTKSVFGALMGILVREGRLSLEDTNLLPLWQAPDPRATITLQDLLRMRSGLQFSEVYGDFSSDVIEMLFNQRDTAAYAASRPLAHPPGGMWSYSSGTTNILSSIARRTLGDAEYVQWPRRALFDPLGMSSAIVEPDASGTFVGSSFMLATARDWARFGQFFLQDGCWEGQRILPDGWVRFSTTPTAQSPNGRYGAHWWLRLQPEMGGDTPAARDIPADACFAIGHEGQTLTIIPSLRLVVVRLGLSIYIDAWNHAGFIADLLGAL